MDKSKKSNLEEEDWVAEKVTKFPCLYDKGNNGYKKRIGKKTNGLPRRMASSLKKVHNLNYIAT